MASRQANATFKTPLWLAAFALSVAMGSVQAQATRLEPDRLKKLFTEYLAIKQQLFFATTQTCTAYPCAVTIALTSTKVGDKEYCIASLPESIELPGAATGNPKKTIRWTLDRSTLSSRTVEFHEDYGVLKVDDGKAQFTPDSKRTSTTVFEGTNKHTKKAVASYVPVILFRTPEGDPELCAVGDPKIVNP